jgi:predicted MPP superfamily phosphohydrolase
MEPIMIIFLLSFLCIYGGINFYAFSRAKIVFHFSGAAQIIIIALFILLTLTPAIVRLAESLHLETFAQSIAYAGYLWMAFIFLFFVLGVALDILRYLSGFLYQGAGSALLNNIAFGLALLISFVLVVYGFFDAQKIRVRQLEIQTDQSLPNDGKIRIVQISDVHIGIIIREKRLQSLLDTVRRYNPDILVSTGDLLDGELDHVMVLAEQFVPIKPKFGKYAIMGNHEYYVGISHALQFTKNAGFDILRDEARQIAGINIFGMDDITGRRLGAAPNNSAFEKLLTGRPDGFVLLLKHQPVVDEKDNFNLQLSGHTHRGQIFPFRLVTHLFFPQDYGFYSLGKDKVLYVSGGAGTWGPPVRIFAPPEITVIDLTGKKQN